MSWLRDEVQWEERRSSQKPPPKSGGKGAIVGEGQQNLKSRRRVSRLERKNLVGSWRHAALVKTHWGQEEKRFDYMPGWQLDWKMPRTEARRERAVKHLMGSEGNAALEAAERTTGGMRRGWGGVEVKEAHYFVRGKCQGEVPTLSN